MCRLLVLLLGAWLVVADAAIAEIKDVKQSALPSLAMVADVDVLHDLDLFLNGRSVYDIEYYGGPYSRRDVVETILAFQALREGGLENPMTLHGESNYRRVLRMVANGAVLLSGPLLWKEDIEQLRGELYMSEPLVNDGEFVAGLYTHPSNKKALSLSTLSDFHELRATSSRHWRNDWRVLTALQPLSLYDAVEWEQMVRMVAAGRADITLAPFQPTDDMSLMLDDMTLVPIPHVKVYFPGSRHWIVSRQHAYGKPVFQTLTRGLEVFRQEGRIRRAYRESGFFNARVEDWRVINDERVTAPYKQPAD